MSSCRLVLCVLLGVLTGPVWAGETQVGNLVVVDPWARATIGQVKTGAAYLTVVNRGAAGDRLVAVATPAAGMAQVHSSVMVEGVMKMRPVEALEIGAKSSTVLEPGGFHVMLMGVRSPLMEGDAFPLILTFERAGSVEVEVRVLGIAAMPGMGSHGQDSDMGHRVGD